MNNFRVKEIIFVKRKKRNGYEAYIINKSGSLCCYHADLN